MPRGLFQVVQGITEGEAKGEIEWRSWALPRTPLLNLCRNTKDSCKSEALPVTRLPQRPI